MDDTGTVTDLFAKCAPSLLRAERLRAEGAFPYGTVIEARDGPWAVISGRRVLMAGSNDYLGLARDPRVTAAAADATRRYGSSCSGAPIMNGTLPPHRALEERLAAFLGREDVLLAASGFQTNLALAVLLGRDDTVYADRACHASIIDAVRLSGAAHRRYRHNDAGHLRRLMDAAGPEGGRLILTEGLFSMDGDRADLAALARARSTHGARLAVDCAHDLGVLGVHGRGAPEETGTEDSVDIVTGTFSKSLAANGGFIAASTEVVHFLRHHARSVLFSAAIAPGSAAAALTALEIAAAEPRRRERVRRLSSRLRSGLSEAGFAAGGVGPIVPVLLGEDTLCRRFWAELLGAGVFTNAVSSPGVPPGREMIRVAVTAEHGDEHVDRIVETFTAVAGRLGGPGPRNR